MRKLGLSGLSVTKFVILPFLVFCFGLNARDSFAVFDKNIHNLHILTSLFNFQEVIRQPDRSSSYLVGVAFYKKNQYNESIKWLQSEKSANRELVHYFIVKAKNKNSQWREAIMSLNLQKELDQKLYLEIVVEHLNEFTHEELNRQLENILKTNPEIIEGYSAYLISAQHYEDAKRWILAMPDVTRSTNAQMELGQVYFYTGDYAEAERIFERLYRQDLSENTTYWYGRLLAYNGKKDEAIPVLEEAIRFSRGKNSTFPLIELAGVFAQLGKCEQYRTSLNKAIEMDNSPETVELVTNVQNSLSDLCE